MNINYNVHSHITFGKNSINQLPDLLDKYSSKKVMLIYDEGVKKAGIAKKVIEQVEKANTKIIHFDQVQANPTNEQVSTAAKIARKEKVDLFIAVGGGSSIDTAKAVNILMTNASPIEQYGGINQVTHDVLPLIAIPTTAGTSSEVTNVTALIDNQKICKYVIIDSKIIPSDVIVDVTFTETLPKSIAAATGMDAITHAVESYISNSASRLTEYQSLEALKIFFENLPKVVESNDESARENMLLGCIIVGYAFSNANLGLVHGIAHTLSAHFKLAHGMANAAILPYVMEYNAPSCAEKMINLGKAIQKENSKDDKMTEFIFVEKLKELNRILKIKSLSEQGIQTSDIEMLAEETLKEPVLNFNPRKEITKEDVMKIIEKAM
jgi:alcohol dehydrogenase